MTPDPMPELRARVFTRLAAKREERAKRKIQLAEWAEQEREHKLQDAARRLFYDSTTTADIVDARRKSALARREEMMAFQKQAGATRDSEMAKFFKGEAQDAMKEYRGACLVLGHLAPGGDAPFRRVTEWPLELIPYAVRATS